MKIEVEFELDGDKHFLEFDEWVAKRPRWLKAKYNSKRIGRK